jgi:hypothetical protein
MNEVAEFYRGGVVHPDGYTIDAILTADDYFLAVKHNYIQWLFPSKKTSEAVPGSPILSKEVIELFRKDPQLKRGLMRSFHRMLQFYGFRITVDGKGQASVQRAPNFDDRRKDWLTPHNHNYKRISRVLESLGLLGLPDAATMFFTALKEVYEENSSLIEWTTFSYWKEAAGQQ